MLYQINARYCPASDPTDRTNENSSWARAVANNMSIIEKMLNGIPLLDIPKNLEVKSGFFQIVDFTKLKGMKYHGRTINTEYDLLKFFYRTSRIRFLVGKSVSWPYEDELIGRITFALDYKDIVNSFELIAKDIEKLKPKDDYIIRKNILADQEQMAHIKVD